MKTQTYNDARDIFLGMHGNRVPVPAAIAESVKAQSDAEERYQKVWASALYIPGKQEAAYQSMQDQWPYTEDAILAHFGNAWPLTVEVR